MKLEDNFKSTLEGRRIAPTASAWDRIEGKLEAEQGKKNSKVVLWIGIAASFVAGVFLTALIFGGDGSTIETELVISTDNIENGEEVKTPFLKLEEEKRTQVVEVTEKDDKVTEEKTAVNSTSLLPAGETGSQKRSSEKKNNNPAKSTYREVYRPKTQVTPKVKTAVVSSESKKIEFTIKTPTGVKNVDNMNLTEAVVVTEPTTVSDTEVDALLKEALSKVKKKGNYAVETTIVVDANELLLDAEAEVDPDSFKDRVFRTLKKELNKAVDAVANKDNY